MLLLALIVFAITMIYFFLAKRASKYIKLLAIQGGLLFVIALINLMEINLFGLLLILLETLLVKAIIIPWFLNKLRRSNSINRMEESRIPVFYSILIMTGIIIVCFASGYFIENQFIQLRFFTVALSTIVGGIYFIIIFNNIFNHIIGFLIMENGAFLLSLAVGGEFPFLVSMAVLIDLLMAFLVLGVFINKIGNTFDSMSLTSLSNLKD